MSKLKKFFTSWRIILLIIILVFMIVAIRPSPFSEGVVIKAVEKNSSAALAGIENPKPTTAPLSKEIILSMNNQNIKDEKDYYAFVENLRPNQTVQIKTTKSFYRLKVLTDYRITELNETEPVIVEVVEDNKTVNKTIPQPKIQKEYLGAQDLGLTIDAAPKSNIRKGLDLQGGTRVLLKPAEPVDANTMQIMVGSLKQRLNVYGLSDIVVTTVTDRPGFLGKGNQYILVEIAGATEEEVRELLAKQGKFEAKIGNATVFRGGEQDITYVCRTAECSGIDPHKGCSKVEDGFLCGFMFSIALSPKAAQKQADATRNLDIVPSSSGDYLSEQLVLFLDDTEVDSLNIASDLQGRAVTDIAISGSGFGISEQEAMFNALENMKRLQTILITGSLPVKLDIVRTDAISPVLGSRFIKNAWMAGLFALVAVLVILAAFYRKIKISLPILITGATEIFITLGFYALFGWNLDLAAIAGLIVAVGTGVDDQIVIIEETLRGKKGEFLYGWKQRIKRAFFIILSAYATLMVAMMPLLFAGAGLLRGFAITTMIGITVGVLITRPAYARMIQILYED